MVFSSLIFLYGFWGLSVLACGLCRSKEGRNRSLLIASLIFYAWGEPKYVLLLMLMAFVSWLCAIKIDQAEAPGVKKLWLWLCVVVDLGLIGYFKYAGLFFRLFGTVPDFISRITLPIGISFYTFQLLTYVVDVYREEAWAQEKYSNVLLYAALFHQCVAGPIVRYQTIADELFGDRELQPQWSKGVSRFAGGLAKKVLLANPCGALAETLILAESTAADSAALAANLQALGNLSVLGAWLGLLAYALQIYLDFSAYSDMAIGMGWMVGLHYPENFKYPYVSRSVTEFWRRWHISLGSFFRDYVYIPLGGNRGSAARVVFNTFAVWALTGLWHGASWNFVLWGLWFFLFLMLERWFLKPVLQKLPVLSHLYLLLVVLLGWVIFRYSNVSLGWTLIKSLFGANSNPLTSFSTKIQLDSNRYLLLFSILAATPAAHGFKGWLEARVQGNALASRVWDILFYSLLPVVLLLLSTACLVGDSYNPFLYFQF